MTEQRIGIYLRISNEDGDLKSDVNKGESDSIVNQRSIIMKHILGDDALKELPFKEFIDDGYSGTNFDRPSFKEMFEMIKSGGISCVIVKDLSRFGRNYLEVGDYLEHLFPFLGVRFIAVNDRYDSNDAVGMNLGLEIPFKNILHDYYSRDLSKKVISAQRSRMMTGKYVAVPPYGYMRDPQDKHHLVPNPDTAPIARKIFDMILDGYKTTEVAYYLNEQGIPSPRESSPYSRRGDAQPYDEHLAWTHYAVLGIVKNYKYTGAMVGHTTERREVGAKGYRRTDRSEWIIHEGMHEAIVTHEEFEKVNNSLKRVNWNGCKAGDAKRGIYVCGHCGRRLKKRSSVYKYLYCNMRTCTDDMGCKSIKIPLADVENTMVDALRTQLIFLNAIKAKDTYAVKSDVRDYLSELSHLKYKIEQCRNEGFQAYTEYKLGRISGKKFLADKTMRANEIESYTEKMAAVKEDYEKYLEEKEESDKRKREIENYSGHPGMTEEEMLELMYQAVDKVSVYGDGHLEVVWKFEDLLDEYQLNTVS